ncbi:MFS transporter [Catellatospora sp. NPDC049609]|uniref:MFS transporter n=1 Tax=Catellatospora sp. NPDC049609 TaxID=3155505 RepID=UPI0034121255
MRAWLHKTVGGLPKAFWYLWCGTVISRSGAFIVLYLQMHMVTRYGFSASLAGLILGLFGGGMAIGSLLGGVIADRYGRRATLLVANIAMALTAGALGLVNDPLTVGTLVALYGFCNGFGRPAFNAAMIDILEPTVRLRGVNLNYWATNLGFSLSAILAGALALTPHFTAFALNAAALLIMAAIVFRLVPETRPGSGAARESRAGGSIRVVFRDRVFMAFVALNLGLWVIIESSQLIPIALNQRGLNVADFGWIIAVNGIMIVIGQLFVPGLIAGRRRTPILAVAAILIGCGMGAVAITDSVPMLMISVAIWTAGEMLNAPIHGTYLAELSPPALRGTYQGVAATSYTLAKFVAPIGGGVLLDSTQPMALWLALAALGVLLALGYTVTGASRDARAKRDQARLLHR